MTSLFGGGEAVRCKKLEKKKKHAAAVDDPAWRGDGFYAFDPWAEFWLYFFFLLCFSCCLNHPALIPPVEWVPIVQGMYPFGTPANIRLLYFFFAIYEIRVVVRKCHSVRN